MGVEPATAFGRRKEQEEEVDDAAVLEEKARAMKRMDLLDQEERRTNVRQPAFTAAEAETPDGKSIACIARNISEKGCKLKLKVEDELPDRFVLRIDGEDAPRPAKIIWREHGAAGVGFLR